MQPKPLLKKFAIYYYYNDQLIMGEVKSFKDQNWAEWYAGNKLVTNMTFKVMEMPEK